MLATRGRGRHAVGPPGAAARGEGAADRSCWSSTATRARRPGSRRRRAHRPRQRGLVAVAYPEGTPAPTRGVRVVVGRRGVRQRRRGRRRRARRDARRDRRDRVRRPARVVLAGESNGGGMVLRAACDPRLAPRLAGVVLVNAAVDEGVLDACAAGAPLRSPCRRWPASSTRPRRTAGQRTGRAGGVVRAASWLLSGCTALSDRARVDDWTTRIGESVRDVQRAVRGRRRHPHLARHVARSRRPPPRHLRPQRPAALDRARPAPRCRGVTRSTGRRPGSP